MTPERYKQIEEIFSAALELEAGKRAAFVERACAADQALRREVESLLAAQQEADEFIETPALEVAAEMLAVEQTRTLAGRMIGPYRIQYLLGAGGMGEIYLAEDTRLDRRVALKLLPAQFTGDDSRLRRLIREARSASALNHPNILTVYDIGQTDEIHFIATEFIEGNTLRQQIKGARLSLIEVLGLAEQIAGALATAHAAGIIHRDIKPENVMVRPDGLVKVLDFGLAKLTERPARLNDTRTLTIPGITTLPGMVMGTPQYMSPEQVRGLQVDHRSDIFSLGVVLYEMLAGCPPFTGDSAADVIAGILAHEPPPLAGYRPDVADDLQQVVARALAKPTDERYQTISDLQSDLKRIKERLEFQTGITQFAQSGSSNRQPATSRTRQREARREPQQASQISLLSQLHPNNLPAQPRSLVGRDNEMSAVTTLLRRKDVRLLTLTGPGGTGKTSLALQAATGLLDDFAGGVFFVSLAAISDAHLVASVIAHELAVQEAGGKPLLDSLKEYLRDKQMLLVLDSFEHLLPAAALVAELLAECPRLKILATSRALLHLRAEHEYSLPPLALPDLERLPAPEALARCPAVALFMQRAVAVKPDFAMHQENARAIAGICIRLDGLPLAIELAAAHIRMLSPQSLLARMEKRFQLLTGGARDLPARQQTMRDAIAWSYELLSEDEKLLFRRLSVFVGGCALEAIEAVCDGTGDLKVDMLSGVASLVDKSLVRQSEQTYGDEAQFCMLETIREYGLECLATSGESEALQQRHAAFYLALAEEAEPELKGSWQAAWLERLEREHGNFRLALQWAKEEGKAELGLRLCGALVRFWMVRNHFREARGWLEGFLDLAETEGASASVQAKALLGLGSITRALGDYVTAGLFCERSLVLYRELDDKRGIANSLTTLATAVFEQDNNQRGVQLLEESLALRRELQDKWGIAISLNNLGTIAYKEGDYERARVFYEESLILRQELEDKQGLAISLNNLGAIAHLQGDYARAKSLTAESLTGFQRLGDRAGTAHCLEGLAESLVAEGQLQRAARLLGAAITVRQAANAPVPPHYRADYEAIIASMRDSLGEAAYNAHLAQGQMMSLDEAVAYALGHDLSDPLQATVTMQGGEATPNVITAAAPSTTQPPSPHVTSENIAEGGAATAPAPASARVQQTALPPASRRATVVIIVALIILIVVASVMLFLVYWQGVGHKTGP
jgi:non-specific serine/threonine protein kinase